MNADRLKALDSKLSNIASRLGFECKLGCRDVEFSNEELLKASCSLFRGDNVDVLAWLIKERCVVDFCYIDPPYNTGNKFVYNDKVVSSSSSSSSSVWGKHEAWMRFMLPRLLMTHELLSESGLFAISIDDYEYAYLKVLMDQVFGEDCFVASLVICRSRNGKGSKPSVSVNHEYVLLYGKSKKSRLRGLLDQDLSRYENEDEHGKYSLDGLFRKKGDASRREDRPSMFYPLYCSSNGKVYTEKHSDDLKEVYPLDSKGVERRWLWGQEKAAKDSWRLYASPKGVVYVKNYASPDKRVKIKSILNKDEYLNDRAAVELKAVFGERIFETPKPVNLIKDLVDACCDEGATVLDYFAGSGTTAHACEILNADSKISRKVILVEQEQVIDSGHLSRSLGYETIADITEARLQFIANGHLGFTYDVRKAK